MAVTDDNKNAALFNRLIFLQRNWQEDDLFGERPEKEFNDLVSS